MEVVTKITTAMGVLVSIGGLGWAFLGAIDFFQGKKNQNAQQTDNGMSSMIYGGGIIARPNNPDLALSTHKGIIADRDNRLHF